MWCGASLCVDVSGVSRQGDDDTTILLPSPPLPPCVCVNIQEGSTLAQCSSEEALEVCSDTEAPNAFQRDGPGRVSIKKGTCRPTGVPCEPFFCTSQGGGVQYVTFTTAPSIPLPQGKAHPNHCQMWRCRMQSQRWRKTKAAYRTTVRL